MRYYETLNELDSLILIKMLMQLPNITKPKGNINGKSFSRRRSRLIMER